MKRALGIAVCLLLLGMREPAPWVELAPVGEIGQGGALLVKVHLEGASVKSVEARAFGAALPLAAGAQGMIGLLGVDMNREPGEYKVEVALKLDDGKKVRLEAPFTVKARDFGTDRLTLPKDKVDLTAENLARVEADQRALARTWAEPSAELYWSGPFIRPVPGEVSGQFGKRRIINDQPRSPHTGQDLRAALGEPVAACNRGRVALVRDCFFSGNSVVIDHGLGLYSMYFHLSEVKVTEGELVEKSQMIGLAGMSGRATGPHLHWGFRLLGARVDPDEILALPSP